MSGLRIHTLGQVSISIDGALIGDVATRKAEALLIYLACNPHPHQREVLSELLWDDLPPERALGNLRLVINQLRPRFAAFLNISRSIVGMRPDAAYWIDVAALERVLASDPAAAADALALYQGDFLQGFHLRDARGFGEWQQVQAEHWRRLALDGMRHLVDHATAWSNYAEGLAWAERLLKLDPLDEAAHRQTMVLLARSGQRHAALRHYLNVTTLLHAELGLPPEEATTALYQRILAGPAQRPQNLPAQVGPLIGRAAELARVATWVARAPTRLLTISGPGGSGKTRLALGAAQQAAVELLGPFNDGVFYLELVDSGSDVLVDEPSLMLAVAHVLDVPLAPRKPLADQVVRFLGQREMLLVIDNGELLAPRARLALSGLLAAATALRLIVASREHLRLRDESILDLDGLSYPEPAAIAGSAGPSPITDSAAIQLLLQHASHAAGGAVDSSYSRTSQDALGQICRLVGGLPLAIELAAPWLALRSPPELLQSLRETLDVLHSDGPDRPERHRSIRAVFEYSWRLLSAQESQALAGLGVFPADFSAAAATAVCGASLETIGALRTKSLVQVRLGEPETRYALHPLVQRFAKEKLEREPEVAVAVRARHARHFAAFLQEREPLLYGPRSAVAIGDIEREFANLRAGWRRAAASRDIAMLGVYSVPLHDFCALRGWKVESIELFDAGAAAVRAWSAADDPDAQTTFAAVRVLSCYAELQQIMGDITAAERAYHDCRVLLNTVAAEDAPELLFVYKQTGLLAYGRGAYAEAMQYLRLSLTIAEERGERVRAADTLLSIGAVAIAQGEWAAAEQSLRRGLALYDALQYAWGQGHALRFLGTLAMLTDDRALATTYLDASLALSRETGNAIGTALALDQLGVLYLAEQQLDRSAAALDEALALFRESGVDLGVGRAHVHLGRLALLQGQPDLAQRRLSHALLTAEQLPSPPLLLECGAAILALQRARAGLPQGLVDLAAGISRHPACTAETQRQIAELIGEQRPSHRPLPRLALEDIVPALQSLVSAGGIARAVAEAKEDLWT